MAVLIDSLSSLDNSIRRKFKKVFERLDDRYLIRTPALETSKVAQIIIEGPAQSWLMMGSFKLTPTIKALEKYLKFNDDLHQLNYQKIKYLAISKTGESLFDTKEPELADATIIDPKTFSDIGHELISELLTETHREQYQWIKKTLFYETLIHSACTTRREAIVRDNSAQLETFFLDYDQELATKFDMFGEQRQPDEEDSGEFSVRLINGVAGSGKTLILINRAILYCKKYPHKKTLLLIHNKPVTVDIEYKFNKYLNGMPENLQIKTFHSFALAQQNKVFGRTKPLFTQRDRQPFVEQIFSDDNAAYRDLNLSDAQIWSEFEYINDSLIKNKAAYLDYDRQGRGFALPQSKRRSIWLLYEKLVELFRSREKGYLPSLYIRELCLLEDTNADLVKYDHILIDEAQFFFPSWLYLVKKSLVETGQLYMCADPNQGFLKSRLSWKRVGLNVRGRTKKLNYSYRTTFEIMKAADALLDYLDETSEDFVKPDLDRMARGSKPKVIYSTTPQDEQQRFLNELKTIVKQAEVPLHQIIILCSDAINPWNIKHVLDRILGKDKVVNCNDNLDMAANLGERIRLMSINSCTGMEAGVTFVLGVGELLNKENNIDLSDDEQQLLHQESIRKLYVAMTRAGQKLVLFSTQNLPKQLEAHVDIC